SPSFTTSASGSISTSSRACATVIAVIAAIANTSFFIVLPFISCLSTRTRSFLLLDAQHVSPSSCCSISPAPEDQRCIDATKRKVIAHHNVGIDLTRLFHDVVQRCTALVRLGQIGIGSKPALLHHLQRHPCLQRATGPKRVP